MLLRGALRGSTSVTTAASRLLSTEAAVAVDSDGENGSGKLKKIGRALETYLKNSKDYTAMMNRERAEFELGKRHLANMMSLDPHQLTQQDVDKAIEYLFPSGLSDPNARPVMKSPDEVLPKFNRFSFDDEGRPVGSRFFTLNPKLYGLLSDVGIKSQKVTTFYNEHVDSRSKNQADLLPINLSGTQWISEDKLKKKLGEKFSTEMYAQLLLALDNLVSLPGSTIESQFINDLREPMASSTGSKLFGPKVPDVQICSETNRRFATVRTHCKDTKVEVTVSDAGVGKFDVNGQGLQDFVHLKAREILLAPMIVANLLGRVDVQAVSSGSGGQTALPRAVRHGAALCIAALYPKTMEPLRLSGLLTLDPRKKERSKVNQPGARAKWIWKRR